EGESDDAHHNQELLRRALRVPLAQERDRLRERLPHRLFRRGTYSAGRRVVAQRMAGVHGRCQLTSRPLGVASWAGSCPGGERAMRPRGLGIRGGTGRRSRSRARGGCCCCSCCRSTWSSRSHSARSTRSSSLRCPSTSRGGGLAGIWRKSGTSSPV